VKGKITIKFAIDENGSVISSQVVHSATTIGNSDLEKEFADTIFQWQFGKIDKRGDVTEVVYPLILSQ
jgi:TonB family protein